MTEFGEVVQRVLQEWQEYEASQNKTALSCNISHFGMEGGRNSLLQEYSCVSVLRTTTIRIAAEVQDHKLVAGMGYIFSNEQHQIQLAVAESVSGMTTPITATLECVRRALQVASSRNLKVLEIQVDVKPLVAWLQRKIPPEALSMVNGIFHIQSQFQSCRFVFIDWNTGSHCLTNCALSSKIS